MYIYEHENKLQQYAVVFVATLAEFLAANILIYLIAFTFGAYLIDNVKENLLFSSFMTCVCQMPSLLLCAHKNPIELLDRLLFKNDYKHKFEEKLVTLAYGCMLGAWFGALVIPLDWDRWWQEWPVCSIIGASLGSILGLVYSYLKSAQCLKQFTSNKAM